MTQLAGTDAPLYLRENDVVDLIDMGDAIEAVQATLEIEARGEAQNMIKTHVGWGDGAILHAIGATVPGAGYVGTKTWAYTKRGANPMLALFDSSDGHLHAIIEAHALGQLRTGAISGVATHWLASPHASTFAIIGTGRQALTQAAAVAAVRNLRSVRVYSRSAENRDAFCRVLTERVGVHAESSDSLEAALDGAEIVTLITRSQTPFLRSEHLADGVHVNAAGAIVPAYAEFFPDLLSRCRVVAADSVASVRSLSHEFMEWFGEDDERWKLVQPLSTLAAGKRNVHPKDGLTLFKSVGMGLSDLALAIRVYESARAAGRGRALDPIVSARPNFRARTLSL